MSLSPKIAVVTGANRGIGFEVCRQLAKQGLQVILTSRDESKGQAAAEQLKQEGGNIIYHPLDVIVQESVEQLTTFLQKEFGQLDVLVNNSGVWLDNLDSEDGSILHTKIETLEKTLQVNLYGPLRLCQNLIPLMQKNHYGRVVNVSSGAGQLADMHSGYPSYRISKTALNALTKILAHEFKDTNILVNSVCPGWVKTDMGGKDAPRTPEQGADTIVWLATLQNDGATGGFFRDRQQIEW
jgi:NAD(P)-dependent dehydrogenase (short-subunit alcohol dehydrogenase family)